MSKQAAVTPADSQPESPSELVYVSTSLPQDLKQKAENEAAANDRTLAAQIRFIVKQFYGA